MSSLTRLSRILEVLVSILCPLNGFPDVTCFIAVSRVHEFNVGITGTGAMTDGDE